MLALPTPILPLISPGAHCGHGRGKGSLGSQTPTVIKPAHLSTSALPSACGGQSPGTLLQAENVPSPLPPRTVQLGRLRTTRVPPRTRPRRPLLSPHRGHCFELGTQTPSLLPVQRGRYRGNWTANLRSSLAASELAGSLKTVSQSSLKDEEARVQRGKVTHPTWPIDGQVGQNPVLLGSVSPTCLPVD